MTKIGNLRVYKGCCGLFRPTVGPYWYLMWFPQIGMALMLGGVLFAMTLSVPEIGPLQYTAWSFLAVLVIFYIVLIFSEPGIPKIILKKAAENNIPANDHPEESIDA